MNKNDDFGQYNCIGENIHGRMEAIVFVLSMLFKFALLVLFLFFSTDIYIYIKYLDESTKRKKTKKKPYHYSPRINSNRLLTSKKLSKKLFSFYLC